LNNNWSNKDQTPTFKILISAILKQPKKLSINKLSQKVRMEVVKEMGNIH